jgi:hypothetical protein
LRNGALTCSPKFISSFHAFVSGTGRGFETAPLRKHKRCRQFINQLTMKKLVTIIVNLILVFGTVAYGQKSTLVGGVLSYDFLMLNKHPFAPFVTTEPSPSFRLGIIVSRETKSVISADVKLVYSQINYRHKIDYTLYNDPVAPPNVNSSINQGFIELEPRMNLRILEKGNTSFYFGVGTVFLFKVTDNKKGIKLGGEVGYSTSNSFNYGLTTLIGVKSTLNKKFEFRVEPNFSLLLNEFDGSGDVGKINRIGLTVTLQTTLTGDK